MKSSATDVISRALAELSWAFIVGLGLTVPVAVAWQTFRDRTVAVSLLAGVLAMGIAWWLAHRPIPGPMRSRFALDRVPRAFTYIILFGLALRVAWFVFVPPVYFSDTLDYWELAQGLVNSGTYQYVDGEHTLLAWRPPGYPVFLAVFIAILEAQLWIPALSNTLIFVALCFVIRSLGRTVGNENSALIAVGLIAVWPSFIAISVNAASEPLSLLLVTAMTATFLRVGPRPLGSALVAGALGGLSALVRPPFLLLPILWFLFVFMGAKDPRRDLMRASIAVLVMLFVIAPWTWRNYQVFRELVPVSTNGGDVFYRANNPMATGGYTEAGMRDLDAYKHDEVLWNETGYAWGKEWIRRNPLGFMKLIPQKLMILMGDDSFGFVYTLGWPEPTNSLAYRGLRTTSNLGWLLIWLVIVVGSVRRRGELLRDPRIGFMILVIVQLVCIHCVFESQPRHHMPFVGLLAVIAGFVMETPDPPRSVVGLKTSVPPKDRSADR